MDEYEHLRESADEQCRHDARHALRHEIEEAAASLRRGSFPCYSGIRCVNAINKGGHETAASADRCTSLMLANVAAEERY